MMMMIQKRERDILGKSEGPMVVLWDSLDEKAKADVLADLGKQEDWVLWKKAPETQKERLEESKRLVEKRRYKDGSLQSRDAVLDTYQRGRDA